MDKFDQFRQVLISSNNFRQVSTSFYKFHQVQNKKFGQVFRIFDKFEEIQTTFDKFMPHLTSLYRGEYNVENLKLIRRCHKSCKTHPKGKNSNKGPSINYVISRGEGGGQKMPILLSKKTTKRGVGGQKLPILKRHSLWMAP